MATAAAVRNFASEKNYAGSAGAGQPPAATSGRVLRQSHGDGGRRARACQSPGVAARPAERILDHRRFQRDRYRRQVRLDKRQRSLRVVVRLGASSVQDIASLRIAERRFCRYIRDARLRQASVGFVRLRLSVPESKMDSAVARAGHGLSRRQQEKTSLRSRLKSCPDRCVATMVEAAKYFGTEARNTELRS